MCEQLNGEEKEFRKLGMRYFGRLCRKRVRALSTRKARLFSGAIVARYFGLRNFPLRGILKVRKQIHQKTY